MVEPIKGPLDFELLNGDHLYLLGKLVKLLECVAIKSALTDNHSPLSRSPFLSCRKLNRLFHRSVLLKTLHILAITWPDAF